MVYVDDAFIRYGRMLMCHMIADTSAELFDMAAKIGVDAKWVQARSTTREHFDICRAKRDLAVGHGAIEVTQKQLAKIVRGRGPGWCP